MTEQRSVTDALGVSSSLANMCEAEGHRGAHLDFPGPCYCQHVVQALPHTAHHCSLLTVGNLCYTLHQSKYTVPLSCKEARRRTGRRAWGGPHLEEVIRVHPCSQHSISAQPATMTRHLHPCNKQRNKQRSGQTYVTRCRRQQNPVAIDAYKQDYTVRRLALGRHCGARLAPSAARRKGPLRAQICARC